MILTFKISNCIIMLAAGNFLLCAKINVFRVIHPGNTESKLVRIILIQGI
jgi:hypothetical protein